MGTELTHVSAAQGASAPLRCQRPVRLSALVFFYLRSRLQGAVLDRLREESVHSRTPVLLSFCVTLPSVEARGRWRERGMVHRGKRSPR